MSKKTKLTDAEEVFCQEYVNTLNLTKAYQKAYPEATYSTARAQAIRVIGRNRVQLRISDLFEQRKKKFKIDERSIIQKLLSIIDLDPVDIFNPDGTVKSLSQIPKDLRKLIKQIKVTQQGTTIELTDRMDAITKLGQHLGMFGTLKQGESGKYLVRIYVVPAISNKIDLPDAKSVAKELIEQKVNRYDREISN